MAARFEWRVESRALLSVSTVANSVSFKDVYFSTTGNFSGDVTYEGHSIAGNGTATISGNILYTADNVGTGNATLDGSLTKPTAVSGLPLIGSATIQDAGLNLSGTFSSLGPEGDFAGKYTAKVNLLPKLGATFTVPKFTVTADGVTLDGSNGKFAATTFTETNATGGAIGAFGVSLAPTWVSSADAAKAGP